MEVDNETCDVIEEQVEKEITKGLTRNKVSRERLKIISKYINIFEVIVIARYIDYKLISKLLFISQKTVERAFKDIRSNPYAKDLIIEIRDGKNIVVYASNSLLRLFESSMRCPVSPNADKRYI